MTPPDVLPVELVAVTPAVAALIIALRTAGLTDRWTPLVAIGLGIAGALTVAATGPLGIIPAILGGTAVGAAATGLHQAGHQLRDRT